MTSKLSTLANSFIICSLVVAATLWAQNQPPREKLGYIRFWDMLPPANGGFVLRKAGAPASSGDSLSAKAYQYSGYIEFPAGRTRMSVYKDTDPNTAIKTLDVDLKQGAFFTILVAPQPNGSGNVELIDDTVKPEAPAGALTVRNYFPGLTVSAASGAQKIVDGLTYGQSHTATGLGSSVISMTLRTRLPNGTPVESGPEVDFKNNRRATLLIIPDSYGRFRPRITTDGKLE